MNFAQGILRPASAGKLSVWCSRSVQLTYGIHRLEAEIAGLSVAEAKTAFRDALNLDPNADSFVNGRRVGCDHTIQFGDKLQWLTEWGRKGAQSELLEKLEWIAASLERIANKLDPPPADKVGTRYVADKLDCSTIWITELIRKGEIPPRCIVPGTGNGKIWKFYRKQIDDWIATR